MSNDQLEPLQNLHEEIFRPHTELPVPRILVETIGFHPKNKTKKQTTNSDRTLSQLKVACQYTNTS